MTAEEQVQKQGAGTITTNHMPVAYLHARETSHWHVSHSLQAHLRKAPEARLLLRPLHVLAQRQHKSGKAVCMGGRQKYSFIQHSFNIEHHTHSTPQSLTQVGNVLLDELRQ